MQATTTISAARWSEERASCSTCWRLLPECLRNPLARPNAAPSAPLRTLLSGLSDGDLANCWLGLWLWLSLACLSAELCLDKASSCNGVRGAVGCPRKDFERPGGLLWPSPELDGLPMGCMPRVGGSGSRMRPQSSELVIGSYAQSRCCKARRISPTIYVWAAKRSKEHRRASSRRRRRSRMVRSAAAGRRRRWSCPHTETQALAKTAFSLGGVPGALKASGWGGGAVFVICRVSGESTREYKGARHVARACIASPGPARSCPRPPWEE